MTRDLDRLRMMVVEAMAAGASESDVHAVVRGAVREAQDLPAPPASENDGHAVDGQPGAEDGAADDDLDALWLKDDDPVAQHIDALWERPGPGVDAPPRPAKDYATVSYGWLGRVMSVVETPKQLVAALLIYSECLRRHRWTVAFPVEAARNLGISRHIVGRMLGHLKQAGEIAVSPQDGHPSLVTPLRVP